MESRKSISGFIFLLIILIGTLTAGKIYGQSNNKIDSLIKADKDYTREDIHKLKIWITLANAYCDNYDLKGLSIAERAVSLSRKLNLQDELGEALTVKGKLCMNAHDYHHAASAISEARNIFLANGNSKHLWYSYYLLGVASGSLPNEKTALENFFASLNLANKIKDTLLIAESYQILGENYLNNADYIKAIKYSQDALDLYNRIKNYSLTTTTLFTLGEEYAARSDYNMAIDYVLKAARLNYQTKNLSGLVHNYYFLGDMYKNIADYENSLLYFRKLKGLILQNININKEFPTIYVYCLMKIGVVNQLMKKYDEAVVSFNLVLSETRYINDEDSGIVYNNLGYIELTKKNWDSALRYLQTAFRMLQPSGNLYEKSDNEEKMARAILKAPTNLLKTYHILPQKRFDTSARLLSDAGSFARRNKWRDIQRNVLETQAELYEAENKPAKALSLYRKFISLRDSISDLQNQNLITRKTMQFEFDKKEDSLRIQSSFLTARLKQEALIAGQQLLLSNNEKKIQQINLLKTQSDLKNEQLVLSEKENQLALTTKEKQLQKASLESIEQNNRLQVMKIRQLKTYGVILVLLLTITGVILFHRNKIKHATLQAELERKMSDATLSSLHTQMNPHFIFNCLGSIKQMILENEKENANRYLNKFAKMIRLSLDYSRRPSITIREKLNYLTNYLEMESLRFDHSFKYKIEVDEKINQDQTNVPPMMIQPLVENAIWHGLMNKSSDRSLWIRYKMGNDKIICEIEDNGIGFLKSKQMPTTIHRSIGIENIRKRLDLLNQKYHLDCSLQITDKSELNKDDSGTLATLSLPFLNLTTS